MKEVLLLGGAGYIGSHIVIELLNESYHPVCFDDFSNSNPDVFERLRRITGKNITYYEGDSKSKRSLMSVFQKHNFDTVIHLAGGKDIGYSISNPLKHYRNELDILFNVLELCNSSKIKKIIFSSSGAVYGDQSSTQDDDLNFFAPKTPYGMCKLFSEYILRDIQLACHDMSIALLRYFNPVGAHSSHLLWDDSNFFMPILCKVASGERQELSIFGKDYATQDGTCVRDYTHVVDLATAHIAVLRGLETCQKCFTYDVGTGVGTSVLELVSVFERNNNVNIPFQVVAGREGEVPVSVGNAEKLKIDLGWKPRLTIDDMVRDSWEAYKMKKKIG